MVHGIGSVPGIIIVIIIVVIVNNHRGIAIATAMVIIVIMICMIYAYCHHGNCCKIRRIICIMIRRNIGHIGR